MVFKISRAVTYVFFLASLMIPSKLLWAVPQQHGSDITQLAPEKCELLVAWTGEIKADLSGADLERWMAQPEILDAYDTIVELIKASAANSPGNAAAQAEMGFQFISILFEQPWIYMDELDFKQPPLRFILKLGDHQVGVAGESAIFIPPSGAYEKGKPTKGTTLADVRNGLSNTLMVVEANQDHAVTWTSPEDFGID